MKRKIGSFVMILFLIFTMTGCVKFNANMDIKKDKSMDFKIIYAFDTNYFGDKELLTDENKDKLKSAGFTVTDYLDGTMKGFIISRNVKNIDYVSSEIDTEYSLSGMLEDNSSNPYVFKVKKGLFKNTYVAKLSFDSSDSSLSDDSKDSNEEEDYTSDDEFDFGGMMGSMDLSFNVNLPYGVINSNATKTSEDGKTLTWTLTTNNESLMEFEFELYNMSVIYIVSGIIIILIVFIVFMIIRKRNNKKTKTVVTDSAAIQPVTTNDQMLYQVPINDEAPVDQVMGDLVSVNKVESSNDTSGISEVPIEYLELEPENKTPVDLEATTVFSIDEINKSKMN